MTTPTPPSAMAAAQAVVQLCPHVDFGENDWSAVACQACIARALSERDEQIEVGHQLTGSFFEALKPLNLAHVNVANPGKHVTDLIQQLRERERELAGERHSYEVIHGMMESAEQEVERLREALKEIANAKHAGEDDKVSVCCELAGIASQALLTRHPAPEANNG